MIAKINSVAIEGLGASLVEVEVGINRGLPAFNIVGLGDTAVQESKERVRSALKSLGYDFPPYRITVNLAPADQRKEGPIYDLPIALGILACGGVFAREKLEDAIILGELSLEGMLRRVKGVLSASLFAKEKKFSKIFVPLANEEEASVVEGVSTYSFTSLKEVVEYLRDGIKKEVSKSSFEITCGELPNLDMSFVKGHYQAKRVLEICAAGGHNILMSGPPGSGKTLLAKTFQTILPGLSFEERVDVSRIYSICGKLSSGESLISSRPFREVHHSASSASIIGGGSKPSPGEISLAHRGVLFLDEIPEFSSAVLEALRQPLEDKTVHVARAKGSYTFPADFILVATMNPCPCGYLGDRDKECKCTGADINRYRRKLSGPFLDRMDLFLEVPRLEPGKILSEVRSGENSKEIKLRVEKAREVQKERYGNDFMTNSNVPFNRLEDYCSLDSDAKMILEKSELSLNLSGRAVHRILRVARTISDLEGSLTVTLRSVSEALQYRQSGFN